MEIKTIGRYSLIIFTHVKKYNAEKSVKKKKKNSHVFYIGVKHFLEGSTSHQESQKYSYYNSIMSLLGIPPENH